MIRFQDKACDEFLPEPIFIGEERDEEQQRRIGI
jgi:hypothetical protein